jgi:hypothetical protein
VVTPSLARIGGIESQEIHTPGGRSAPLTCVKARWARLVADGAPRGLCPRRRAGKLEGIVPLENVGMLKMAEEFGFSVESDPLDPPAAGCRWALTSILA